MAIPKPRPLLRVAAMAVALGAAAAFAPEDPPGAAGPAALALAIALGVAAAAAPERARAAAAAAAFAAAGLALGSATADAAWDRAARWADFEEKLVEVEGVVASAPAELPGAFGAAGAAAFDLALDSGETVRVRLDSAPARALGRGDRARVRGWLAPLARPTNPGEEDRRPAAYRRGRVAEIRAGAGENAAIVNDGGHPLAFLDAARERGRDAVRRAAPGPGGALLLALVLGDRSGVERDHADALRETGTIHLLAISGLHVLLLGRALNALLGRARTPEPARRAIVLSFLAAYSALVGFAPPVARAAIMAGAGEAAAAAGRRLTAIDALALAALAIVALDPAAVLDAGAQLSFAAVLALVLLSPRIEAALPLPRLFARPLALSAAAFFATAPILAARFALVSPGSLAANLVAAPAVSAILVAGAPALLVSAAAENPASDFALFSLGAAFDLLLAFLERFARVPGVALPLAPPSPVALAAAAAALALAAAARRRARALSCLAIAMAFTLSSLLLPDSGRPPLARLTVLDVGQGAAAILETAGGFRAALDCGSSSRRDAAARIIAPYLAASGRRMRLDLALLSHPDADHVNAAPWLSRLRILRRARGSESVAALGLANAAATVAGDAFPCGDGVTLRILHPPRGYAPPFPRGPARERNDASLVVAVETPGGRALVPGDVQEDGIRSLLESGADLRAEVLVLPHHGSFADELPELLRRVRPRAAIASARRGFVPRATRDALALEGIPLFETASCGAVTVEFADGAATIRAFLEPAR